MRSVFGKVVAAGIVCCSLVPCGSMAAEKGSSEVEVYTDTQPVLEAGYRVLDTNSEDYSTEARIIEREIMPAIAKGLPEPAPGYRYALTDLDGDGAPELFLIIKHVKVCDSGCPVRIYKFKDGIWKMLLEKVATQTAIRPPVKAGDKPKVAFLLNGDDPSGATTVTVYEMTGDRLDPEKPVKAGKKR